MIRYRSARFPADLIDDLRENSIFWRMPPLLTRRLVAASFFLLALSAPAWAAKIRGGPITAEERQLWSLQPITDPAPPPVNSTWPQNDIDRFILDKLNEKQMRPVDAAGKRTLLRRVTYDLTGLPPSLDESRAFLADDSPNAIQKVVERLLRSSHYGEQWGRHWLDVVRYADTAGETGDYPVPLAYKYRNWVIDAFNADMPYNEFIRLQLAGDIIAKRSKQLSKEAYASRITATGFIAISRRFGFDVENYHFLTIQDTLDTLGQSVLGLSLGCARCHDHKYDPVNMDDYYALYGIFESTNYSFPGSEEKKRPYDMVPLIPPDEAAALTETQTKELAALETELTQLEDERRELVAKMQAVGGEFQGFEIQALNLTPSEPWSAHQSGKIASEAQSPFQNVVASGTRGLRFPSGIENTHFGRKLSFPQKPKDAETFFMNLDFRNLAGNNHLTGAYRFYLGHGPGTSAAMELAATKDTFFIKRGANYQPLTPLKLGEWYNLQVTLNVKTRTYQGALSAFSGESFRFSDIPFTPNWDGVLDQFFVDRYGHLGGPTPARDFDNFAADVSPFAPADHTLSATKETMTVNRWPSFIEPLLLKDYAQAADGHQGFHVWRKTPLPCAGINLSSDTIKIPGTVPPGSFVVHPGATNGVAVAWRSPIRGQIDLTGTISDAHDCGNSVSWAIDHLSTTGFLNVSAGAIARASRQSFEGKPLNNLHVEPGDYIQLAILPKGDYGCDLTQIEFRIRESADGGHEWILTKDVLSDSFKSNPHGDSYGNPNVWHYYEIPADYSTTWNSKAVTESFAINVAEVRQEMDRVFERMNAITPRRDALKIDPGVEYAYGAFEGEGKDTQIHNRGDHKSLGKLVARRNLTILGGDRLPEPETGSGRLQLADWMTRDENPLTARVMVNRIWQKHFGQGLVPTENDFGARGELPTHPELLDWLASRFIESNWSVKSLHRLILNSATYQLASTDRENYADSDPEAQWRWRFERRRLSAEEYRDSILRLSGLLDTSIGEEHPFPPEESWGFTQHSPYYGVYETKKRSIYLMQQRLKRHPFLALLDGADPNVSTAERLITTTPTQALYLMNSPFIHENAMAFARDLIKTSDSTENQLIRVHETILGRTPSEEEIGNGLQFIQAYVEGLKDAQGPENERTHIALAAYVRTVFVRNEFLFID